MNYRHSYHAGNFADVVKHAVLARILTYLKLKPQPFRVIDTHAGTGRYDLAGTEANKTGEWQDGIARLYHATVPDDVAPLLAPYLDAVRSANAGSVDLKVYPGSPLIAHHLLRPGDSLIANELHPEDFAVLKAELRGRTGAKALNLDAWVAVKSLLPPPERRGVILIDPPFEHPDEFDALAEALAGALQRFANGVYLIWYPVKNQFAAGKFVSAAAEFGCSKMLDVRLKICEPFAGLGLTETGLLVLNPPFSLQPELDVLLPYLTATLSQGRGAAFRLSNPMPAR